MVEKKCISSAPCINIKKVKQLPTKGEPNTIYYVKGDNDLGVKNYITDINGNPTLVGSVTTLLDLLDVIPKSYSGQGGKFLQISEDEKGIVFSEISDYYEDTLVNINLTSQDEEVILQWQPYISKHGLKPASISLYERNTQYNSKCTSPDYTEDNGLTYKWYVGLNSPRQWEIRISGYTTS